MRPHPESTRERRSAWVMLVSAVCILGWAVPAILMAGKGFSIEDEGSYLLSYRWWDSNPYFVSGAQFFYGPMFQLTDENVDILRLVRLAMVVGANAWFAWAFILWLDHRRPAALPASRTSLVLLLTACGGMAYLWSPLTPGYYDLTADASLALAALMFSALTRAPDVGFANPWLTGAVAVVLLVTKWPAAPVLVLTVGVCFAGVLRESKPAARRYGAMVLAGAVSLLLVFQLFVMPLGRYVSVMWTVSSLTATASHGIGYLAGDYAKTTALIAAGALILGLPLLASYVAAARLAAAGRQAFAHTCLFATAGAVTVVLPLAAGWRGGRAHGRVVLCLALAGLLTAAVVALGRRADSGRPSRMSLVIGGVLFLVPWAQAAGTNVPLVYVAGECLAMWVAGVLLVLTREECPRIVSTTVVTDLLVLVAGLALIAGSTTLKDPFKTSGYGHDTASVPHLGLSVSPGTAAEYRALERALAPHVQRAVTPILTLDEKAGLTYLLGGVPAGSTWTDASSPGRTAGILELACRNGDLAPSPRPVLIIDRPLDAALLSAMAACGFGHPARYRALSVASGPPGISVLVPRSAR